MNSKSHFLKVYVNIIYFESVQSTIYRRDEFFQALKKTYFDTTNENLPVFGVPAGKLKDYSTSKKDMKRGVEIVPEENYRLRQEDIYSPKTGADGEAFGQKGKSGSVASTTDSSQFSSGGEQFGEDYDPKNGFRDSSRTLYAKKGDSKVALQDFIIKKVIGRGSFGKVFLVEKKDSKEVYAMKSLRKDVILDYDQVESTKLEKEILM